MGSRNNKSGKRGTKIGKYYTFPSPLFRLQRKLNIVNLIVGLNIREVSGNYKYPLCCKDMKNASLEKFASLGRRANVEGKERVGQGKDIKGSS